MNSWGIEMVGPQRNNNYKKSETVFRYPWRYNTVHPNIRPMDQTISQQIWCLHSTRAIWMCTIDPTEASTRLHQRAVKKCSKIHTTLCTYNFLNASILWTSVWHRTKQLARQGHNITHKQRHDQITLSHTEAMQLVKVPDKRMVTNGYLHVGFNDDSEDEVQNQQKHYCHVHHLQIKLATSSQKWCPQHLRLVIGPHRCLSVRWAQTPRAPRHGNHIACNQHKTNLQIRKI